MGAVAYRLRALNPYEIPLEARSFMNLSYRLLAGFTACLFLVPVSARAQRVSSYTTVPSLQNPLAHQPGLRFNAARAADVDIVVDESQRYQTMDGFGAAMTDSAAWLLEQQLNAQQRAEVMRRIFDPQTGIGVSFLRVPLGASDLARNHYSYDDQPKGQRDTGLQHFSIAHDQVDIFPALLEARKLNPDLTIMLSPWSPPGWMKANDSMIGGTLREDAYKDFAAYLSHSVLAYEQAGLPVRYLSLQNEPLYETKDYPGMFMPAEQQARLIGEFVGPALAAIGHPQAILAYDHNWDHPEYPLAVLADTKASGYVAGTAFHCYGGEVTQQQDVLRRYPGKGLWMTECSGGTWQTGDPLALTAQLLIESVRNGSKAVVLWGLALDEKHGPNAGGCDTCRGLVTIDRTTHPAHAVFNADYYAIGHASRFVHPGATRIASTDKGKTSLETVAFRNRDGAIALVILNHADREQSFTVMWHGRRFAAQLPAGALATYLWR
jgi:glucosylceramidase